MTDNEKIFLFRLDQIQPSQLYISARKLGNILTKFNYITTGAITPVPVINLDGKIIYSDGHTRAFALWQKGENEIRAYWDKSDIDQEAYRICVGWCNEAGIYSISDLENRILSADDYEKLWLNRCHLMHKELKTSRER